MSCGQTNPQESSKTSENKKLSCPNCKGTNIIQRGFRKTQNRGLIQRYSCKGCGKRFVINEGFYRMRNNPQKITLCLDLFFRGISLRKSQEHLQAFYPHNSSHMTILRWIRKYSIMISNYTENLQIKNSNKIMFDEMEFKTKGKQSWFIDVLDPETRYMVSSGYYPQRGQTQLREVLIKSKQKLTTQITDVYTDGLLAYPKLLRKTYGLDKRPERSKIEHHIIMSNSGQFNWKVERLHNNIRERTKIMRQFKSVESAKALMKGYEIFYNFCRKHQGINCYPYELALPDLKLGQNKWLDLIKLSAKSL